jgi:hypothetical protein
MHGQCLHNHEGLASSCGGFAKHPFQYAKPSRQTIRGCPQKKRILVCSDFHYANALLNPHFIHNMELRDNQQAIAGLMGVF